jgi:hypothetical protein
MENKNDQIIRVVIGVIIIIILTIIAVRKPHDLTPPIYNSCNEDSLRNVITQLRIDNQNEEDGWDKKEHRYEDVLFEYELGISYLKDYHPKAYQDFHRIIGMKERYSNELERENKKRLQLEKFDYE